jgi:hypothetical protein
VQGVSHPRHGRAHPSAQGHSFFPSLLARDAARCHHVSVPGIACRALCFCEPVFVPCISFAGTCECGRARVHPNAQDRGVTFWLPRHRSCGRRALLAAPSSLRTGLRGVPDWMDRGSCTWCRPGKRTPAQRPSLYRRRCRHGATPVRERTARLREGGRHLPCACLDPTCGGWAVSSVPAYPGPMGAQLAKLPDGPSLGRTSGLQPLGQLGRTHWATVGPVTLSAQYRPANRGSLTSCRRQRHF